MTLLDLNTLYGSFPRMARDPTYWVGTIAIAAGAVMPQLALKVLWFQLDPEPYQVVQYYERTRKKRKVPKGAKLGKSKTKGPAEEPLQGAVHVQSESV